MSYKLVPVVAVPAVLGIASIRVKESPTGVISPRELSVYTSLHQCHHYTEKEPGLLQTGLGKLRGGLQSCLMSIKSAFVSVKVTAVNVYHGGEDIYHFLKDPPSGFVPRVAVITVSGLAGVILARKGSRLKRMVLPLSLTTAGFAICYPVQTIAIVKVGGKTMYTASRWTSATVASLWRSDETVAASLELAPCPEPLGKVSGTQTVLIDEASEAQRVEETSPEVLAAVLPDSDAVLAHAEHTVVPVDEDILETPKENNTTSSELPSLQSSGVVSTPTAVPSGPSETSGHGTDPRLMDFGQSNPEDADLYSTRS
ncbi:MICOS complex subunit MIC27 [Brachyhypopomus gauderio]|uniref:MICOS complex subunit MIC27 n=1 Tax=Brachyhypopomus gauderio TaxID=698409 RepID=UPI004041EF08